jgi:cyclase
MKKILVAGLGLALSMTTIQAHDDHDKQEDKRDFAVTTLSDNIHVLMGINGFTGGNIALLTGPDGVIMIDDSMPPLGAKLKAAIAKVTPDAVDFIINTHVHGDHTGLNAEFARDGSWIIGHENLRKQMKERGNGVSQTPPAEALPVITFSDEMGFHLNNERARIIHMASAHTSGDAIIHYAEANIIHTGDLMFNGLFPYIDLNSGGSVNGYLMAQQKMLSMSDDNTKIIPGHGPMSSKADLQAAVDMLQDCIAIIQKHVDEGMTEDEVVKANPLQKYHDDWNWGFITTERMTRQLFKGLSAS